MNFQKCEKHHPGQLTKQTIGLQIPSTLSEEIKVQNEQQSTQQENVLKILKTNLCHTSH